MLYAFHARTPLLCRSQAVLKRSAFRGALIPSRLDSRSFSARWVCERAEVGCDILSMSGATLTTRTPLRTVYTPANVAETRSSAGEAILRITLRFVKWLTEC